jgi:hypothetical protein
VNGSGSSQSANARRQLRISGVRAVTLLQPEILRRNQESKDDRTIGMV